jgi:hypothetical protein
MFTVYFINKGRFANNLFQYFAAQIIKKIFGCSKVKYVSVTPQHCYIIDDEKFKKIIHAYINLQNKNLHLLPKDFDIYKDICLCGFFQRSEIFEYLKDYIKELYNVENKDLINDKYRICDTILNVKPIGLSNDLIVHVRLDDFIHDVHNSEIFDPIQIKSIIKNISYDKLYIICDKLRYDWEKKYMNNFDDLNPTYISSNLLEDFSYLKSATKILISGSTLSWIAAFLGDAGEVHIPYHSYHGGFEGIGCNLEKFNDNCFIYKNMEYWKEL